MAVIWLILKWIGIILLFLLGLFLLLLLTVLFCAIRYRLEASYYGKADLDLDVRWLFSLLSVRVSLHDGALCYRVSVFGKTFLTQEEAQSETGADRPVEAQPKVLTEARVEEPAETGTEAQDAEQPEESRDPQQEAVRESNGPEKGEEESPSKKKFTFSFQKICDKIKAIREKKDQVQEFLEDPENKKAFALIKRQVFRLFRHILPRHFTARLHFGFEDPAVTGQVLGYICMFYALYGNNLSLEPDFQEKVLEGECRIKGRIRPGCLLGIVGRLFFQKRIRSWIFHFIK